jgi:hypothetical protein
VLDLDESVQVGDVGLGQFEALRRRWLLARVLLRLEDNGKGGELSGFVVLEVVVQALHQ